jgi:5-methylcytosine-specific restriction enzyme subunit McrC
LIDESNGTAFVRDFLRDEKQMAALFERFVRNFYSREQVNFSVRREVFGWNDVEATDEDHRLLPGMTTDVSLESRTRKIVIDTKYYANTLQRHYNRDSVHSANLYQLFSYLKNLQVADARPVEGVLLYPTIDVELDLNYRIQGSRLRIVTLNLNADWRHIRDCLLRLAA